MMDSADLVDRYKRYKSGTKKIFDYIITATRNLPEFASILPAVHAANKAVKHAKKRPDKASVVDLQVTVPTSRITKLATLIAQHSTVVPKEILTLLNHVISDRKECAAWYAAGLEPVDSAIQQKNEGHQHFIAILVELKELLLPLVSPVSDAHQTETVHVEDEATTENMFANLNLEEPSSSPLGAQPATKTPEVTFKHEATEETEKAFAIWCFLQDMYEVRQGIKKIWTDYAVGHSTFAAASFATETGIALMRVLEDNFLVDYPKLQHFPDIALWMEMEVNVSPRNKQCFVIAGCLDRLPSLGRFQSRKSADAIAEFFCPQAILILNGLREILEVDKKTIRQSKHITDQMPSVFCHDFGQYLLSLKPEFDVCISDGKHYRKPKVLNVDNLLGGLITLSSVEHISSWLTSACQVYMDIFDILYNKTPSGLDELETRILEAEQQCLSFETTPDRALFDQQSEKTVAVGFKELQRLVDWWHQDPTREATIARDKDKIFEANPPSSHRLERVLPLFGGTSALKMQRFTHHLGLALCETTEMVLCAAYLYRACVQAGLLHDSCWSDMDFVIAQHSKRKPLVLEIERDISSMGRFLALQLGTTPESLRKGQRNILPARKVPKQKFESEFPFFRMYQERKTDVMLSYKDYVAAAIECADLTNLRISDDHNVSHLELPKKANRPTIASFAPTQLLHASWMSFKLWEPELNFNYTDFYTSCRNLVTNICHACTDHIRSLPLGDRPLVCHMVCAILMDASDTAKDDDYRSTCPSLSIASDFLLEYIESHGDKFYKMATEKSTGHVPLDISSGDDEWDRQVSNWSMLSKLLIQWDCPNPGRPNTMLCRSSAEADHRLSVSKAVFEIIKPTEAGGRKFTVYPPEMIQVLEILEPSAVSSIQRMNEEEEVQNLVLFVASFLWHPGLAMHYSGAVTSFIDRVYSAKAQRIMQTQEVRQIMGPEWQEIMAKRFGCNSERAQDSEAGAE